MQILILSSQMTGWVIKLEWQAVEMARNRVFLQPCYLCFMIVVFLLEIRLLSTLACSQLACFIRHINNRLSDSLKFGAFSRQLLSLNTLDNVRNVNGSNFNNVTQESSVSKVRR